MLLGDNTVKELKNQFLLLYASNLISRRKFRMITFQYLRKSHTHDKIDALWGVIARRIANETRLLDADSTVFVVQQELQRPGLRQWVGSTTELNISKFNASRDWKNHWSPQGTKLQGGLLEDATANHAFILLCRKGQLLFTNHSWLENFNPK